MKAVSIHAQREREKVKARAHPRVSFPVDHFKPEDYSASRFSFLCLVGLEHNREMMKVGMRVEARTSFR